MAQWPQPWRCIQSPGDLLKFQMPALHPRQIKSEPLGVGFSHPQVICLQSSLKEPLLKGFQGSKTLLGFLFVQATGHLMFH